MSPTLHGDNGIITSTPRHSLGHKNSTYAQVFRGEICKSSHCFQLLCNRISFCHHKCSIAAVAQGSGLNSPALLTLPLWHPGTSFSYLTASQHCNNIFRYHLSLFYAQDLGETCRGAAQLYTAAPFRFWLGSVRINAVFGGSFRTSPCLCSSGVRVCVRVCVCEQGRSSVGRPGEKERERNSRGAQLLLIYHNCWKKILNLAESQILKSWWMKRKIPIPL